MANVKKFCAGYATGSLVTVCVKRRSDGWYLLSDGSFSNAPEFIPMLESPNGYYEYSTDVEVWDTGEYNVLIALNVGGGDYDGILAYFQWISGDTQIGWVEASSVTSKNTTSSVNTVLQSMSALLTAQASQLSVMSDRIDSFQQILSRRDYGSGTT